MSIGGRLGYVDDGTTPNTQIVFHGYKKAPLIFEVRGLPQNGTSKAMDNYRGSSIGVVVDCEGGYLVIPSYTNANFFDKEDKPLKSFKGGSSHFANFIKAVRSRNFKDLTADLLEGHLSSALCHTGNERDNFSLKESVLREIHQSPPIWDTECRITHPTQL